MRTQVSDPSRPKVVGAAGSGAGAMGAADRGAVASFRVDVTVLTYPPSSVIDGKGIDKISHHQ